MEMWSELYGKSSGCAAGKAGSMHLIDTSVGFMGTSAIVATAIPNAVGYAWAQKQLRKQSIVVNFFGDGATDEGVFYESLNFASLKKVPIIFLCENNKYAIYSSIESRSAASSIAAKAELFGIPARVIDDGNIFTVYEAVTSARKKILEENHGPVFIEVMTCRWRDHVGPGSDQHIGYRDEKELRHWKHKDQIQVLADIIDPEAKREIDCRIEVSIADAIAHAEADEFPNDLSLTQHLFNRE